MRLRTVKVCEPRPYGKAKNRMLIAPVPALSYTDTCIHKRVVNSPIGIAHSTGVVLLKNVYPVSISSSYTNVSFTWQFSWKYLRWSWRMTRRLTNAYSMSVNSMSACADVILWNNSPYGKRWSEVVSIATWCLSASHLASEHIYCYYQCVIDYSVFWVNDLLHGSRTQSVVVIYYSRNQQVTKDLFFFLFKSDQRSNTYIIAR